VPSQTYNGPVRVYDKKADGTKLVIGKGDRKGEPYYKVSFQVDGEWVNLMDFEGITNGVSGEYQVTYYQKYQPNGEPELFNDKPQYQLESITPLGGAQTGQNAPSTTSVGSTPSKAPFDAGLSAKQTSANDATQIVVAAIAKQGLTVEVDFELSLFDFWFDHIHDKLTSLTDDALMKALDATPADADDRPEQGDPDDEDIPF